MPITISILDAVAANVPRELLPAEFLAIVNSLEAEHDDRLPWGMAADWLQDHDEPSFASAFRYVAKRPEVTIQKKVLVGYGDFVGDFVYWTFNGLPWAIEGRETKCDTATLLATVAGLAQKLEAARKELE